MKSREKEFRTGKENRFGQMEPNMSDHGRTVSKMAMELNRIAISAITTRDIGLMVKSMGQGKNHG